MNGLIKHLWVARLLEAVREAQEHIRGNMIERRIYTGEGHAHFITFSCDKKRKLLQHDNAKRIVIGSMNKELAHHKGNCPGFVIMPDHVHAIVEFSNDNCISRFMHSWKRKSSWHLRNYFTNNVPAYAETIQNSKRLWRPKYYDFNLYSESKLTEKLAYMHNNPVRAGLVKDPAKWPWSSARWYEYGQPVGVKIV